MCKQKNAVNAVWCILISSKAMLRNLCPRRNTFAHSHVQSYRPSIQVVAGSIPASPLPEKPPRVKSTEGLWSRGMIPVSGKSVFVRANRFLFGEFGAVIPILGKSFLPWLIWSCAGLRGYATMDSRAPHAHPTRTPAPGFRAWLAHGPSHLLSLPALPPALSSNRLEPASLLLLHMH